MSQGALRNPCAESLARDLRNRFRAMRNPSPQASTGDPREWLALLARSDLACRASGGGWNDAISQLAEMLISTSDDVSEIDSDDLRLVWGNPGRCRIMCQFWRASQCAAEDVPVAMLSAIPAFLTGQWGALRPADAIAADSAASSSLDQGFRACAAGPGFPDTECNKDGPRTKLRMISGNAGSVAQIA